MSRRQLVLIYVHIDNRDLVAPAGTLSGGSLAVLEAASGLQLLPASAALLLMCNHAAAKQGTADGPIRWKAR